MYTNSGSGLELLRFLDSDYAGNKDTRRSTIGYIFELANEPITWCSKCC